LTTIAFDGRTMVADKRSVYGDCIHIVTKIFRAGDCLVGGAGEFAFILAMVEWVRLGRDPTQFPASQRDREDWQPTMVVEPGGQILIYERTPHPIRWERRFGAIGSGKHYAMAAMLMGYTAREALDVAAQLDPGTGNGTDSLALQLEIATA
jgi:ATP-dependent protease HslVU (ClpYQ) peptidase subunit